MGLRRVVNAEGEELLDGVESAMLVAHLQQDGPASGDVTPTSGLDAGALGVIVPLVNNREQTAEVVRAMKYPNNKKTPGIRSCGPVRSMGL